MRFAFNCSIGALLLVAPMACGGGGSDSDKRPPPYLSGPATGGGAEPDACEPPPTLDQLVSCGNDTVRIFERQPTIYFVLDTSGSMQDYVLKGKDTKIEAARTALKTVVSEIGHRVKYGMTAFPGADPEIDLDEVDIEDLPLFGCAPGDEVFAIEPGDPITCVNRPPSGPVLARFNSTLRDLEATGGTPLSPTLAAIAPNLLGQEGTTAVVLVTDGSPNCNADTECEAKDCSLNLTHRTHQDIPCDDSYNCCDPDLVGDDIRFPAANCVDGDASVRGVELLQANGIDTYVIGVRGNEDFDDVMNRLAVAGGQPREGDRAYYDVENLAELTDTIRAIGSKLAQNCELELLERPAFAGELNVYFDAEVVPSDPENGWTAQGNLVTLHGEACEAVQKGNVTEVQMISGCQTVLR